MGDVDRGDVQVGREFAQERSHLFPGGSEPLIAALRQTAVQSAVDALGGYDLARSGTVHMLD